MNEELGIISREFLRFFERYGKQLIKDGYINQSDSYKMITLIRESQELLNIHDHCINIEGEKQND